MENSFSHTLLRLREITGESQDQVAEAADISRVAYTRYENGTREPKASTAIKIARHFGITVEQLFCGDIAPDNQVQPSASQFRLSDHEREIIRSYRAMPASKQEVICELLHIDHQSMPKAN